MLLIIAHDDLDGKCAGEIVYRHYINKTRDIKSVLLNYGTPTNLPEIKEDDTIYVVDCRLQSEEEWNKVLKSKNVVWIDHHKSTIEDTTQPHHLEGIREIGRSGCELTWEFFYSNTPMPRVVAHIGDMDVWRWALKDTEEAIEGLNLYDTIIGSSDWLNLFQDSFIPSVIGKGKTCLQYRQNYNKKLAEAAYIVNWMGYTCLVCNTRGNSKVFDSLSLEGIDIRVLYWYNGNVWVFSLYSENIDVTEITDKYSIKGHAHAAGMQLNKLPDEFLGINNG
jgi:oligoribonuclease NrnB/cAMP/cGMP phosphodiesterase (DHH superfamily)